MKKKVVAVVPVKMNNERVPGKNVKRFSDGTPLIRLILETLKKVRGLDEVCVYCSNPEIRSYLPENVRFLRRSETLDQKTTTMNEILRCFANDVPADVYLLAHATAPFVSAESLERGLNAVLSGDFDSAFSAKKLLEFIWKDGTPLNYALDNIPRTQDLPLMWAETAGFYVMRSELITKRSRRIGDKPFIVEVGAVEATDIDYPEDFEIADAIYSHIVLKRGEGHK